MMWICKIFVTEPAREAYQCESGISRDGVETKSPSHGHHPPFKNHFRVGRGLSLYSQGLEVAK